MTRRWKRAIWVMGIAGAALWVAVGVAQDLTEEPAGDGTSPSTTEVPAEFDLETARAQLAAVREAAEGKEVLAKGGQWESDKFDRGTRSWQVNLERDEKTGRITGQIRVSGSRLLAGAVKVDGQMNGSNVSGVIIDDAGNQLATFAGVANGEGMSGTYVSSDGDEGKWSFDD